MKCQASTAGQPCAVALATTSLLILLGACAPSNNNAPTGVDPCGRLTAASVKTAFGLDTNVVSGDGRSPAPPVRGPGCVFTADTQLAGSAYAWTYQLRPLSLDPAHPPVRGMPAPANTIGTPIPGLGDTAILRHLPTPPPMTIPPRGGETSAPPKVSISPTSVLLTVWKGSWVYEFRLDYTTDAPGGLSSGRAESGLIDVARASGL